MGEAVLIELDDGKIGTGLSPIFHGKNLWFPVKIFP